MNKRKETYRVIDNDLPWLFQTHKSIHKHNGKGHILADGKSIRYNLSLKRVHGCPLGTYLDTKKSQLGYHYKASVNLKDITGTDFVVFGSNSDPILENLRVVKPTNEVLAMNAESRADYFTVWFRTEDFVNFDDERLWNYTTTKDLVGKSSEIAAYKKEPNLNKKHDTSVKTTIMVNGSEMWFESKLKCYEWLKKNNQTTQKDYKSWLVCFNRKLKSGAAPSYDLFGRFTSNVTSKVNPYKDNIWIKY
jgi:hypothetical protein